LDVTGDASLGIGEEPVIVSVAVRPGSPASTTA
jgi:hypothetical protein